MSGCRLILPYLSSTCLPSGRIETGRIEILCYSALCFHEPKLHQNKTEREVIVILCNLIAAADNSMWRRLTRAKMALRKLLATPTAEKKMISLN
jgi:hypothetical protein